MNKTKVILVKCTDYERNHVETAIEKGINLLGEIETLLNHEEKILLKPNLLAKAAAEKAVTTHPEVFRAVGKSLRSRGFSNLYYGDSPGNPLGSMIKVAEACGIKTPADELDIKPADFSAGKPVTYAEGKTEKNFIISNGILECDSIINICKMKTHQLERITGACKNMFGAVYGFNKGAFHAKYTNADSFAEMIADLNNFIKPKIHIMDGITAMEGNGPQSGTPVDMKIILISKDPVALDTVFCSLIDLNPRLVPTNVCGHKYQVGTMDINEIEVITEEETITVEEAARLYGNKKYNVYRGTDRKTQLRLLKPLQPLLEKSPYIRKEKCVKCGICIDSCPLEEKAIALKKFPIYDYKKCIRCYCCQEMCPRKAIDVKTPVLAKLMDRNWKI